MTSPKGTYRNPTEKQCWETCQACFRCAAKGTRLECSRCSGRFDLHGITDPHEDDRCRCTEGVLQYVKADSTLVQVKYKSNPFKGSIQRKEKTPDERDWENYVTSLREKFGDENYNPIKVTES